MSEDTTVSTTPTTQPIQPGETRVLSAEHHQRLLDLLDVAAKIKDATAAAEALINRGIQAIFSEASELSAADLANPALQFTIDPKRGLMTRLATPVAAATPTPVPGDEMPPEVAAAAAEAAAEPVAEPVAEAVAEPVTEPVAEPAPESVPELVS